MRVLRFLLLSVLLSACFLSQSAAVQTHECRGPVRGIVFAVNGSGDSLDLSDNLKEIMAERRLPFAVETIHWTGGEGQIPDHNDVERHSKFGRVLAAKIGAYHRCHPDGRIIVISHSSGTHVALVAAALVPDGIIDRMFLLAPCVGTNYDLRRPLQSVRAGIDSYYSERDHYLQLAIDLLGTGDRKKDIQPAGVEGFSMPPRGVPAASLYAKLRQHAWVPQLATSGHFGGHYGWVNKSFLQRYIVPELLCGFRRQ